MVTHEFMWPYSKEEEEKYYSQKILPAQICSTFHFPTLKP